MAPRKPARKAPAAPPRSSAVSFLLGVFLTAAIALGFWFFRQHPQPRPATHSARLAPAPIPVTGIPPAPTRPAAPSHPPSATPPFSISEDVFEAGAQLYARPFASRSCASCHGSPAHPGAKNPQTVPPAAQFFIPTGHPGSPSQLFLSTKYGVPGSPTMPAYAHTLSDRQIWQIALLLANATQPLPDPVTKILNASPPAPKP